VNTRKQQLDRKTKVTLSQERLNPPATHIRRQSASPIHKSKGKRQKERGLDQLISKSMCTSGRPQYTSSLHQDAAHLVETIEHDERATLDLESLFGDGKSNINFNGPSDNMGDHISLADGSRVEMACYHRENSCVTTNAERPNKTTAGLIYEKICRNDRIHVIT
jgi:hypothetical protein